MVLLKFVVVSGVSALGNKGEENYCVFFKPPKNLNIFFFLSISKPLFELGFYSYRSVNRVNQVFRVKLNYASKYYVNPPYKEAGLIHNSTLSNLRNNE